MKELIDKAEVIAEIERRIKEIEEIGTYLSPKGVLTNLLCHLDTLEVKEVDLEKEYKEFIDCDNGRSMFETAKYFFELGIKTKKRRISYGMDNIHSNLFAWCCNWL